MDDAITIDVPEYFICPISLQMMKDPVTTVTGITYDRESIQKWLSKADVHVCPVTKQPLPRGSDLTPNHMLRRLTQAWCVANAKNGIDRIPTPKSPLHRSVILKFVRDLKNNNNILSLNALKKMDELLASEGHEKTNRKLMADAGVANAVFFVVLRRCKDERIDGLDRALRILQLTWTPSAENRKVLDDDGNYLDKFVNSVLWILNRTDLENGSHVKSVALANLKNFTEAMSSIHLEKLKSSFLSEIVKVLRGGISPQATKSALQILIEASRAVRNRSKIVESGAVLELVEMELANPAEKRTTELIFCLLAQLCSCAEGRQRLLEHGGGVAVAAKRLLRVSAATDDRIMCVMESIARFAAPQAVVGEMLRVGGVSKLCMVMQADCDGYLKKKAREILRLHFSDWSNSPCIQIYPSEEENRQDNVVSIELPAPAGWVKKLTSKPQRNDVVFISPNGEDIKNKRQLDQYVKSHPGELTASEFDWGSGDTPWRSTRLSEKSKAGEAPASGSPTKRRKKLSGPEGAEENITDAEEEKVTDEKDPEGSVVDAKEAGDGEGTVTEEAILEKPESEKAELKTEAEVLAKKPDFENVETKTEDSSAIETQTDMSVQRI